MCCFSFAQFSSAKYIARGPRSLPPIPIWTTVVNFSPAAFVISPSVYLIGKISNSLLLLHIEFTLIHTICHNSFSKLSTGQLMKNQTVLSGVNDCTVVKLLKFFGKLCFFC